MRQTATRRGNSRWGWWGLGAVLVLAGMAAAVGAHSKPAAKDPGLRIYFVDVEGGQSTLFVTPEGHSLLIDTGWDDNDGRDAGRIVAAAKDAGIRRLDYVLLTHYHADHAGGFAQIAERMPIGTVIDHGENRETGDSTQQVYEKYLRVVADEKLKRIIAKPGDVLPVPDVHLDVISADGETITNPLPGAGQENPACKESGPYAPIQSENPRSLGTLMTFGKLRILDLGDLTNEKEMLFMCPRNLLGHVDILVVSHHGTYTSSSPALIYGIAPRVAIVDNGAKKGGTPAVWDIISKSPGLEGLWQLHFAEAGGAEHNSAEKFLANLTGPDAGNYLKLTAWADGHFELFNSRTRATTKYPAHK